ncbi:MAG: hypothetical protein EA374_00355 [Acholeplasmatales bacterium]|nr:MAG: hypothetical protein EA374_00355 [Acholeplasmatales bacterium]
MKKISIGCVLLILFLFSGTRIAAETGVRYHTFTLSNNRMVRTQTAYLPLMSVRDIHGQPIGEARDIHIDHNNIIYIATRVGGVGQIIVFDMDADDVRILGADFLQNPTGVFVNQAGDIFVADRTARQAYRLSQAGDILQTFTRPDSPLFGAEEFQPNKIISDNRGNVYILNLGTRGLAQFSPGGQFLGYFGTNTIAPTLRTVLQQTFFTEEQRSRLFNLSPPEIANMAIDDRGLIHTVSRAVDQYGVKRLNISGQNVLPAMYNAPDLVDVFVGPIGNIYVLTRTGVIYEYDIEGNLLFAFGGLDISNQIQGLFNTPAAIAVDSHFNIYTLDSAAGEMKIFFPTAFTQRVHTALALYQEGFYVQSQEPWERVLRMNDFFDLAHRGLGNAHYGLGEFDEAREAFMLAYDRGGYSDAFWEVRNRWLLDHVGWLLGGLFALLFVYVVNLKLKFSRFITGPLKRGIRQIRDKVVVLDDLLYLFTYLRNPADATYAIKREKKVSFYAATVWLGIFFLLWIHHIYHFNFLFNHRNLYDINVLEEIVKVILPIVLFVLANTLIASIREGEGRFRDVYITTLFALSPFFLSLPIMTFLSNALTYNEAFLIDFIRVLGIGISAIYFFFMVKETHFYTVGETVSSIMISAFTMVMAMLGIFIVYILMNELGILVRDVVMEVYYRVADR